MESSDKNTLIKLKHISGVTRQIWICSNELVNDYIDEIHKIFTDKISDTDSIKLFFAGRQLDVMKSFNENGLQFGGVLFVSNYKKKNDEDEDIKNDEISDDEYEINDETKNDTQPINSFHDFWNHQDNTNQQTFTLQQIHALILPLMTHILSNNLLFDRDNIILHPDEFLRNISTRDFRDFLTSTMNASDQVINLVTNNRTNEINGMQIFDTLRNSRFMIPFMTSMTVASSSSTTSTTPTASVTPTVQSSITENYNQMLNNDLQNSFNNIMQRITTNIVRNVSNASNTSENLPPGTEINYTIPTGINIFDSLNMHNDNNVRNNMSNDNTDNINVDNRTDDIINLMNITGLDRSIVEEYYDLYHDYDINYIAMRLLENR